MPKITQDQAKECLKITEHLISWPICDPFILMDNPEPVDSPKYSQYVRNKPMSLYEVKKNLVLKKYDTVDSWEEDIKTIFKKAKSYYGKGTMYHRLATEASNWFEERMSHFEFQRETKIKSLSYIFENSPFPEYIEMQY
ncbi:Transcriptional activator spt7 [Tritrichomonas musculus]|uniref:Transcriptional activator spt7 n=1 Tax=Tritrichomonas musculus TaxID=1915356 RepID=A0ABR2KD23_9EUKA